MRRKDKEIDDIDTINAIMNEAMVCRLAMVEGDRPYVVPLCFGYHDKTLFFHSALEGKKIDILKKNPSVCFEVDKFVDLITPEQPCKWSLRYQSVIGFGTASIVEAFDEKRKALMLIFAHYGGDASEFPASKIRATSIIRVDIQELSGKASVF